MLSLLKQIPSRTKAIRDFGRPWARLRIFSTPVPNQSQIKPIKANHNKPKLKQKKLTGSAYSPPGKTSHSHREYKQRHSRHDTPHCKRRTTHYLCQAPRPSWQDTDSAFRPRTHRSNDWQDTARSGPRRRCSTPHYTCTLRSP